MGKSIRRGYFSLIVLAAVACSTAASAQNAKAGWTQMLSPCWSDLLSHPELLPVDPVPVGCGTVDCCTTCSSASKLNWRLMVTGDAVTAVDIAFDNLTTSLPTTGQGSGVHITSASSARLDRGTFTLKGLPLLFAPATPPVGRLSLALNSAWTPQTGNSNRIEIVLDQLMGQTVVNEFSVRYDIQACTTPSSTQGQDRIDLTNNTGSDPAIVLLNARRDASTAACSPLETTRATGTVSLGNVIPNGNGCASNVSVFSDDNAMTYVEQPPDPEVWTDGLSDQLTLDLKPRLMEKVTIWLVNEAAFDAVVGAVEAANERYNSNNAGIGFDVTIKHVDTPEAETAIGSPKCERTPAEWDAFENGDYYVKDQVNVYYVKKDTTAVTCSSSGKPNIVYVGTTSNVSTLAHEFGHSLSLQDRLTAASDQDNIMREGSSTRRTHLFEGQVFRMNMHCTSTLNLNKIRPVGSPMKSCADTVSGVNACTLDHDCPPLDRNIDPK